MIDEIQRLLRAGDSFAAIEQVQRQGSPLEIAARYQSLLADLYWKAHDLPAAVVIGRAGILYCLGESLADGATSEAIEKLRSIAKGLAYNVGSFTWPGWEEPGISPTPDELAAGRDCARLNLRLAIELKKPADRVSMAHWLIGAHALAARDFQAAESEFQLAQNVLRTTDSVTTLEFGNFGYHAVARLAQNSADAVAHAQFEETIAQLGSRGDDDAKVHLAQLLTARRMFVSDPAK